MEAGRLHSKRLIAQVKKATGIPRPMLKDDLKIIATAIAHRAVRIYTDDEQDQSLAQGQIIIETIPPLPLPPQTQQTFI
jgi:hypothetical protein